MFRFHIHTQGCKVNQSESRDLREAWLAAGRQECGPEEADRIVVNSCAVTERALADLRALLRRLRRVNPTAHLVLTGCAPAVADELAETAELVDEVVPHPRKASLLAAAPKPKAALQAEAASRSRAVLKVQDGCNHGCSFCIVPTTRGGPVSRPYADILAEAERRLDAGHGELVLAGVNLRQYADPATGGDFWRLLARLETDLGDRRGRARLRLSSLDPGQLTDLGLETLAASAMTAPHLHLSIQSGAPAVLTAMRRGHYGPEDIRRFVTSLRGHWELFGLGADILTGFPGETEADHAATLDLLEALPLTYAHVFPFSPRPGTRAAALPGQLQPEVKKERAARLRGLAAAKKAAFLRELVERNALEVLVEDAGRGTSGEYAACRLDTGRPPGTLTTLRPLAVEDGVVVCGP